MAAKQSGDSKQGLIITVVCFVLLSIILGVTTYMGYDGQAVKDTAMKKAQADEGSAKKDRDAWKFRALAMQTHIGLLKAKDEQQDYQQMRQSPPQEPSAFTDTINELEKTMTFKGQHESFAERVERLNKELANAREEMVKAELDLKKAKESYEERLASKEASVSEAQKNQKKANDETVKDKQDNAKALEDNLAKFDELSRNLEQLKKKYENDSVAWESEKKKLAAKIADLEVTREKLAKQLTPTDWLKFDEAKGKITRLDSRGEMAYINLGTLDNLRPQQNLTFSIFSPGSNDRPSQEYKGSLEVLDIVGPHLSKAKIIQIVDPGRNPILQGDVLVNPTWSPQQREHVAIAGIIDLTGDRRNNIEEFMTNLERQGVTVDAYLDTKDNTIKGPGMTLKTAYLIRGDEVDINDSPTSDPKLDNKIAINAKITEMQSEAQRLGVTTVPFRRFVQLIGYKLPKGAGVSRRVGDEYKITPAKPTAGAEEGKKEQEKKEQDKPKPEE